MSDDIVITISAQGPSEPALANSKPGFLGDI